MITKKELRKLLLIICTLVGIYIFKTFYVNSTETTVIIKAFYDKSTESTVIFKTFYDKSTESTVSISTPKNIRDDISLSPWIQYKKNWTGEMLIISDVNTRQIIFPKKYIETMTKKGPHPLTQKYPKFDERLRYIDEHCPNLSNPINYKLNLGSSQYGLHFNDDYEAINCVVAKAASSAWIFQFEKMKDPSSSKQPVPSNYLASDELLNDISLNRHMSNSTVTARRMQTYTKFFVQRHPFERVVSGFINKFENPTFYYYIGVYAKQIIIYNHLRSYPMNKETFERDFQQLPTSQKQEILKQINRLNSAQDKFDITFKEFVTFITSSLDDKAIDNMDIHWKPATRICNPCAVRYDVVIDHDNVSEESQMLADYLQTSKPTNHQLYIEPFPRTSTRKKCNSYFATLSLNLRQKLYKVYRDDFLLLGYECNLESESSACEGVQ